MKYHLEACRIFSEMDTKINEKLNITKQYFQKGLGSAYDLRIDAMT